MGDKNAQAALCLMYMSGSSSGRSTKPSSELALPHNLHFLSSDTVYYFNRNLSRAGRIALRKGIPPAVVYLTAENRTRCIESYPFRSSAVASTAPPRVSLLQVVSTPKEVKLSVLWALGRLSALPENTVKVLISLMCDFDAQIRSGCAYALTDKRYPLRHLVIEVLTILRWYGRQLRNDCCQLQEQNRNPQVSANANAFPAL